MCGVAIFNTRLRLLHSTFDQPDAESIIAQYDQAPDALTDKLLQSEIRRSYRPSTDPTGDMAHPAASHSAALSLVAEPSASHDPASRLLDLVRSAAGRQIRSTNAHLSGRTRVAKPSRSDVEDALYSADREVRHCRMRWRLSGGARAARAVDTRQVDTRRWCC